VAKFTESISKDIDVGSQWQRRRKEPMKSSLLVDFLIAPKPKAENIRY
jgi:hypothetical protein